jgi:hypothetical protein
MSDVESRTLFDTISVFNGPAPDIRTLDTREDATVGEWISARVKEGVTPHEFGVFVRSQAQLDRARAAVTKSGLPFKWLRLPRLSVTGSRLAAMADRLPRLFTELIAGRCFPASRNRTARKIDDRRKSCHIRPQRACYE